MNIFNKLLLLVFLSAGLSVSAFARSRTQGNCEQGGNTVSVPGGTGPSTTSWQQSFPSCTVTVYLPGTTTLSTIYADATGTTKANPFTAAATGLWFFYSDNTANDVKLSAGGIASAFTLGDLQGSPAGVFLADDFAGSDGGRQIAACLTALPSGGGVCDARGLTGAVTISTDICSGITVPAQLWLGAATLTSSALINCKNPMSIIGGGRGVTTLTFTGVGGLQFNPASAITGSELRDLSLTSTSTSANTLTINNQTNMKISDVYIQGAGSGAAGSTQGINIANFARSTIQDVEVRKYPGDCIAFNGEASGGISIIDVATDECTGYNWNFTRTTTADTGDYYIFHLTGLNSTSLTKPGGLRWFSSNAGQSSIPTFCIGCAGDSTLGGDSIIINNVTNMYFSDAWGFNSALAAANFCGIALTNAGMTTIHGGLFRSASRALCLYSSNTNVAVNQTVFQDATNAIFFDAVGTKTRVDFNGPIMNGVTNTTNDSTQYLTSRSTAQQIINGNVILGSDGSGNSQLRSQRTSGNGWWLLSQASNVVFSTTSGATDQTVFSISEAAGSDFVFANRVVAVPEVRYPRGAVSLANGANNNVAVPANTSFVKIAGPTGVFNITGFVPSTNADGQILHLYNSVAFAMTISNNNAGSSAANRILTLTGGDVTLRAGQSYATFIYDNAQSLWVLVATN